MLRVLVESAKGLPKKKVGSPDPIVTVIFREEKKKTRSIDNELNPVWNETLEFDLKGQAVDANSYIDVVVKDYETIGKDKFMGSAKISLRELASGQARSLPSKNVPLVSESGQSIGATINLVIGYDPPASATNLNDPQGGDATVDSGPGGAEEGDETTTDGDVTGTSGGTGTSSRTNLRQRLARSANSRRRLANKPQDFQVRVRIIEARQLPGNNIKPVVKVNVCGQTHRTRIKRGNNPFYDEMMFYNAHMLPSDLFEQNISFKVYNSYSLRADSLMGEFKLDVGYVYDEPAHCVIRKWLLLNDPEESSSGAKGYLKVSLFVVGVGDEPPVENKESNDDQDDIENNLLLPAGVTLRLATLSLKVYRAEDIPQMDDAFVQSMKEFFGGEENKKNLVDPFLEARFAGKKLCTQIMEKNANPEWNQVLNLQIKFPSMCERIKLTVFDWDRLTGNDAVGTTYLNLAKIASSGGEIEANTGDSEVGFLPVFGPCYINLYGSPREFTGLPDPYEELNHGKGEGVAYRGRVLVELSTKLEEKTDKIVDEIPNDDLLVVQKYQRRRKYCLCAVFHSASMLQEPGEPIQFEVSIGNYGNKLDTTCKPLASTTQYSCAVFDGNHYYYLPWAGTKPVVVVTSYWEDISHRLDSVNIILYITSRLQANLEAFKVAILAKVDDNKLVEVWLNFYRCQTRGSSNLTSLDIQIKKLRDSALATITQGARQMREEPQNSMPDVVIWMLRGEKRVAYSRIPAHQILYSTYNEQACGQHCGKTQTVFLQYPMDKTKGLKVPVQIRVNMWLGLSAHEKKFNSYSEGTSVCLLSCLLTEADAGHTEFMDEVFQNETRFPGGEWKAASEPYTDVRRDQGDPEGWEFSSLIGWKFHSKERSSDTFRRRRWRRKMAPEDRLGASAIFQLEGALGIDTEEKEKGSKADSTKLFGANTPTVSCSFDRSFMYHLRVYIYQARNLTSMDKDSFSGEFYIRCEIKLLHRQFVINITHFILVRSVAHVSFLHLSKTTEKLQATLNPTWDQTLMFNKGKDEPLGRSRFRPLVKLNPGMDQIPKLLWYPIFQSGHQAGEALMAAELILRENISESDLPLAPSMRGENLYMVPQGIRPVVQLTAVEILAWGLRNMKTFQLATVSSPSLVVECGGQRVESAVIKNMKKSPNFPSSVLSSKW
ncbi:hypothetical protein WMY93_011080 [Mugilogobius chulae]|uniref:C2 domain-containing protein n=1 Tax=Mugilogobius chulae TaxID=88201 RepID=A0AAW0PKL7_9GOBI